MTKSRGIRSKKAWTDEDVNYLVTNYGKLTSAAIAAHLGRSRSSLNQQAFLRGLTKKIQPWTEADINFLHDNHESMGRKDIAAALKRDFQAVKWMMNKIGLFVPPPASASPAPVVSPTYGQRVGIARVYLMKDRPARLDAHESAPCARNHALVSLPGA